MFLSVMLISYQADSDRKVKVRTTFEKDYNLKTELKLAPVV